MMRVLEEIRAKMGDDMKRKRASHRVERTEITGYRDSYQASESLAKETNARNQDAGNTGAVTARAGPPLSPQAQEEERWRIVASNLLREAQTKDRVARKFAAGSE